MNKENIKLLKEKLALELNQEKIELFENYEKLFLEKNSIINLISKNDAKLLFEKHIFDSLALNLFFNKYSLKPQGNLLDIGTGGGFPSLPLAILYENLNIVGIDSIRKKINAIDSIKTDLKLSNLNAVCDRVENYQKTAQKFDLVTSRAVASLDLILQLALPSVKKNGYFIAYKSKKAPLELEEATNTLKRLNAELVDTIEYVLPLDEIFERNLMVFKKK